MLFKKLLFIFAASGAITGTPADREFKLPAASSGESDSVQPVYMCCSLTPRQSRGEKRSPQFKYTIPARNTGKKRTGTPFRRSGQGAARIPARLFLTS